MRSYCYDSLLLSGPMAASFTPPQDYVSHPRQRAHRYPTCRPRSTTFWSEARYSGKDPAESHLRLASAVRS